MSGGVLFRRQPLSGARRGGAFPLMKWILFGEAEAGWQPGGGAKGGGFHS